MLNVKQVLDIALASGAATSDQIISALKVAGMEITHCGGAEPPSLLRLLVADKAETARQIAAARKSAGLSQDKLAEILDCHVVTVSKLETGVMDLTMEWILRIADALDVPPARFIQKAISMPDDPLDIVREILARRNISANYLAANCGVAPSTLNRALNNPAHKFMLSTRTLKKIREWDNAEQAKASNVHQLPVR